ncbi:MAG: hypothetical protein ACK475_04530 [Bacteroidota bacterium]|jgi:hypothetical protein
MPLEQPDNDSGSPFKSIIAGFTNDIEALHTTLPLTMLIIESNKRLNRKKLHDFVDTRGQVHESESIRRVLISHDAYQEYSILERRVKRAESASTLVPRSFLVALVSQYDAFLGSLVRQMFTDHPGRLNASEQSLTFKDLLEFSSIDDARDHVIDSEIEKVLRKNHTEQFDWLEKQLGISLRQEMDIWPTFIEITERRNLLVHASGRVSKQYINICRRHKVKLSEELQIGDTLNVDRDYFDSATNCIAEIGIKLGQVLWRKTSPHDIASADESLIDTTYRMLVEERYSLVARILDFATTSLTKKSNDADRRVLLINQAQAYKWMGQQEKAAGILDTVDWTAVSIKFRLCELVIRGQLNDAINLVEQIGSNGEIRKDDYRDWPVFQQLRQDPRFQTVFLSLFGEEINRYKQPDPADIKGQQALGGTNGR